MNSHSSAKHTSFIPLSTIIFQYTHNAHWCTCPNRARVSKFHFSRNQALAFILILKEACSRPHYHKISAFQSVSSITQAICCQMWLILQHNNATPHSPYWMQMLQPFHWKHLDHPSYCLGCSVNTWEGANATPLRKWKWLFMNGWE